MISIREHNFSYFFPCNVNYIFFLVFVDACCPDKRKHQDYRWIEEAFIKVFPFWHLREFLCKINLSLFLIMHLYVSVLNWIGFAWCDLSQNKKLHEQVVELEGKARAFLLCTIKILVLNTLSCWPCTKNGATMSHQDMYACDMLNLGWSSLMFCYASKGDWICAISRHWTKWMEREINYMRGLLQKFHFITNC